MIDKPTSTLCFECQKATDGNECPWVRDFTPVPGWWAHETRVAANSGYDSYHVVDCPLCKKDAYSGGNEWRLGHPQRKTRLGDDDVIEFAARTIEQAIDDWKTITYFKANDMRLVGQIVWKADLIEFFNSKWFERLLAAVTDVEPSIVRKALKIPHLCVTAKGGTWRTAN